MICSLFKMSPSSHFNIYTSSTVGTEPSLGRKITWRCSLLFVPLSLPSLWRKVWLCGSNLSPKPRKASPLLPACPRGKNELLSTAHLNVTILLGSGSLSFTLFAVFFFSVFVSKTACQFSLASTLVLLHLLPGGGQSPPWSLLLMLGVPSDYFHHNTLLVGLFWAGCEEIPAAL